jgi:hypothetical protein
MFCAEGLIVRLPDYTSDPAKEKKEKIVNDNVRRRLTRKGGEVSEKEGGGGNGGIQPDFVEEAKA